MGGIIAETVRRVDGGFCWGEVLLLRVCVDGNIGPSEPFNTSLCLASIEIGMTDMSRGVGDDL